MGVGWRGEDMGSGVGGGVPANYLHEHTPTRTEAQVHTHTRTQTQVYMLTRSQAHANTPTRINV